jgi:hypothetical protein
MKLYLDQQKKALLRAPGRRLGQEKQKEKSQKLRQDQVALGGVMVSVLPTGLKVRRFKPGQGDGFLMAIKIHSIPSFRGEVKLKALCHKILLHVKNQMCYMKMSHRSLYTCYH